MTLRNCSQLLAAPHCCPEHCGLRECWINRNSSVMPTGAISATQRSISATSTTLRPSCSGAGRYNKIAGCCGPEGHVRRDATPPSKRGKPWLLVASHQPVAVLYTAVRLPGVILLGLQPRTEYTQRTSHRSAFFRVWHTQGPGGKPDDHLLHCYQRSFSPLHLTKEAKTGRKMSSGGDRRVCTLGCTSLADRKQIRTLRILLSATALLQTEFSWLDYRMLQTLKQGDAKSQAEPEAKSKQQGQARGGVQDES